MIRFPTRAFRENRMVFSKEELEEKANEAILVGKSCEIEVYSFVEWENNIPVEETIIIDKVVLKGEQEILEKLAERKFKEGIESVLLFDGESFMLFLMEGKGSLEELKGTVYEGATIVDVHRKITIPNFVNMRSGKMSKIIRKWKNAN
jgi:hypothetical protein